MAESAADASVNLNSPEISMVSNAHVESTSVRNVQDFKVSPKEMWELEKKDFYSWLKTIISQMYKMLDKKSREQVMNREQSILIVTEQD